MVLCSYVIFLIIFGFLRRGIICFKVILKELFVKFLDMIEYGLVVFSRGGLRGRRGFEVRGFYGVEIAEEVLSD